MMECLDMMADPRGSNHVSLKDSKDPYFYLQHVSGVAKLAIGAGNDDFFHSGSLERVVASGARAEMDAWLVLRCICHGVAVTD